MFTFPLDPHELFVERSRQFATWGIPTRLIRRVQARVNDSWREGPGGWSWEWWQEAEAAENKGQHMLAAMLYGAARFPVLASPLRVQALEKQVACFERGVQRLSGHFERRLLPLQAAGGLLMAVHLYAPDASGSQPLLLLTGGVDTGKMELHRMAWMLARLGGLRVAAIDMPGTGESHAITLSAEVGPIYEELLATLAPTGLKAVFGVSFGGHWATRLALRGAVDAAIDLGGPVAVFDNGSAFAEALPYGMAGIVSNAAGLDALPQGEAMDALMQPFSLRRQGLLDSASCAPMLVINGEHDQYIPQTDSTVFARYPDNTVWLMRGMTHCAAEGLLRIFPAMVAWLRLRLHGDSGGARLALRLAKSLLPARV